MMLILASMPTTDRVFIRYGARRRISRPSAIAGISAALNLGTAGREGLILGLWFSMISLATFARAGLVAGGVKTSPELLAVLLWMPGLLWTLGGLTLLGLVYYTTDRHA